MHKLSPVADLEGFQGVSIETPFAGQLTVANIIKVTEQEWQIKVRLI